ncbi:unnamed protein product [Moneuplotes crassus]|uniref:Uncharacterized protein n=1 Tax=Euplotes crassus TaxID=5936 RepID=A0AAD1XKV0_EUPCR|nr:unnamed protein product [Moneuplotes crassus]
MDVGLEEDFGLERIVVAVHQEEIDQERKRAKKPAKNMRKRSFYKGERFFGNQKQNIHKSNTSGEKITISPSGERCNTSLGLGSEYKGRLNNLVADKTKVLSSIGGYSSYHCESISGFESTFGDTTSSPTLIKAFNDGSKEKALNLAMKDREQALEIARLTEMNNFKDDLLRCFSRKLRNLKAENLEYKKQAEKDRYQLEMYQIESKEYQQANISLSTKLLQSVKFLAKTTEINEKDHEQSILQETLNKNVELNNRLSQIDQENQTLRKFLNLQVENNSFKSFAQEIQKFEEEAQNIKGLSPSRNQETHEKGTSNVLKSSIRDKFRRGRRKRTESFHYSEFGESSVDDEESKDTTLNKLRRKSMRVQEFSSGYSMQAIENLQKQTEEKSDDSSSSSFSSSSSSSENSQEEEKRMVVEVKQEVQDKDTNEEKLSDKRAKLSQQNRLRIQSAHQMHTIVGFSPLTKKKMPTKQISEDSFAFGLKKGGGYKMSIKSLNEDNKENEESNEEKKDEHTSTVRNRISDLENDDEYSSCFKKSSTSKSDTMVKRGRRVQSMAHDTEDPEYQELSDSKFNMPAKIRYSIHSIIEEEKSKSSSSTSSVKSSDDLTYYFNTTPNMHKRKRSSFVTKKSSMSQTQESESSGNKSMKLKRLTLFKTKKYTDSHLNFLEDTQEKIIPVKKKVRRNSMAIILSNL